MGRLALMKAVTPAKIADAVRLRGIGGVAQHAVRRVGALAGSAPLGPGVGQGNPTTYVCNHPGPMCWLQHRQPENLRVMQKREKRERLELVDYIRLFDGMLPGLREVMLIGGGEPLAHPEAIGIMREVKRHGWRGSLITNGSLLHEDVSIALIEMHW